MVESNYSGEKILDMKELTRLDKKTDQLSFEGYKFIYEVD